MPNLQAKAHPSGQVTTLGLYCHVPFCASTCDFCAFYQEKPRRGDIDRYLAGMEQEFLTRLPEPVRADTVFWGGGTPGLLPASDLLRLGQALLDRLSAHPAEWTVEMAPSTVKADKLAALATLGVTRISLGVQSFNPATLDALGRQHTLKQIEQAWTLIRGQGWRNVNLDLIFGIPDQTEADWLRDLDAALALAPEHISTYCLTFEEDTALYLKLSGGKVKRDPEQEARFFEITPPRLASGGYQQYEISNYARSGHACIHNINTWRMTRWLGFGPSAATQNTTYRFTNVPNLDQWLAGLENGRPARVDVTPLNDALLAADALIFGLRMNDGVDLSILMDRFPDAPWSSLQPLWSRLENEGYLIPFTGRLQLTPAGRILADQIGVAILEAWPEPGEPS